MLFRSSRMAGSCERHVAASSFDIRMLYKACTCTEHIMGSTAVLEREQTTGGYRKRQMSPWQAGQKGMEDTASTWDEHLGSWWHKMALAPGIELIRLRRPLIRVGQALANIRQAPGGFDHEVAVNGQSVDEGST